MPQTSSGLSAAASIDRLRPLYAGQAGTASLFAAAHTTLGVMVGLHLLLAPSYLSLEGGRSPLLPAAAGGLAAAATLARAVPAAVRAALMAGALGLCVALVAALPHLAHVAGLDLTLVLLAAAGYRQLLAWLAAVVVGIPALLVGALSNPDPLLMAEGAVPVGSVAPLAVGLVTFALAVSAGTYSMLRRLRQQGAAALQVYRDTNDLLSDVRLHAATEHSLDAALQLVLESLCDARWPVGHVYRLREELFVSTDVWSAGARLNHAPLVAAHQGDVMSGSDFDSPVGRALQGGVPVWLSVGGGNVGSLAQELRPWRLKEMAASGLTSALLVPVCAGRRCVAVIELFGPAELTGPPEELHQLQLIGAVLGQVAEREEAALQIQNQVDALNAVAGTAPDAVVVHDLRSRRVLTYNRSGFTWWPEDVDVVGAQVDVLASVLSFDFGSTTRAERKATFASGGCVLATLPGPSPDVRLPVEIYSKEQQVGSTVQVCTFVRDVTSREQALDAWHAASERASSLLEAVDAGVLEVYPSGLIRYANRQAEELLNAAPGLLAGSQLLEQAPFLRAPIDEAVRRCEPGGRWRMPPVLGQLLAGAAARPVVATVLARCQGDGTCEVVVTLTDASPAERAAEMAMRQAHALELNDTVVQGVSTALYGLERGDTAAVEQALRRTLTEAKKTIATLLADAPFTASLLERSTAAQVGGRVEPSSGPS